MKKFVGLLLVGITAVGILWLLQYAGVLHPAQTKITSPIDQVLPIQNEDDHTQPKSVSWKIEPIVQNVFVPWSVAFTSPTRFLFTERSGAVRVVENGTLQEKPLHTFTKVVKDQEEGLMGMTIDPHYEQNHYVYLVYAYPAGKAYTDTVVRFVDSGDHLEQEKVLLDGIPAAKVHAGSRIKFGPDDKLYITTGDGTNKSLPQDTSSLGGKILRINADGSIPTDNPFPNSPVWSYGHRNPQGLAWNDRGDLLETEHGPSGFDGPLGGDEVNIIIKGKNYGWPVVSHDKHKDGMEDPLLVFTPAIAPAAGLFYTGDMFPQWKGHFLFAMLKGEGIMDVTFTKEDPLKVQNFEKISGISVGRIRELAQAPDGSIYFSTSNEDGRGNARNGDDTIYRIVKN